MHISSLNISLKDLWKASLFIYLVSYTAFSFSADLTWINTILLYFFFAISIISLLCIKDLKFNIYMVSMLCFLVVLIIGFLFSTSDYSFDFLYAFLVVCGITLICTNYICTREDMLFIFKALMIGGIVQNIYIFIYYGVDFFSMIVGGNRIGAVAGNLNEVGLRSCYSAIFAIFFAFNNSKTKQQKLGYFIVAVVCSFFAVITASKKVLILLIMGIVFNVIFNPNKKNSINIKNNANKSIKIIISIILLATLIALLSRVSFFSGMINRFVEFLDFIFKGEYNSSDNKRLSYITKGIQVFLENPILGEGTGASYNHFGTYSHCNFVEILMNNGIVGFLSFYLVYVALVHGSYKKYKYSFGNDKDYFSLFCVFLIMSILVLSIAMVYYNQIYYQVILAVIASNSFSVSISQQTNQ